MDAIETLMTEHRLIERAIGALAGFADEVRRKDGDDKEELARFVTFLREFADTHHHGKEEDILFAAMVEAGFPRHGGPVAVMLMEHEAGRAHIRALAELAAQQAPWSPDDRQRLADAAHGYGNLLRAHIHKEDAVLYPMAEQRLPQESLERVSAECAAHDAAGADSGRQDELHALAQALLARHAPLDRDESSARPPPRSLQGCC
ncbi:hemerythrin domain-containing protein [Anaeromyxobacter diazotrophicus]|uniref:Hemerythrin-like domain-containing protein n=1 Tax=Anaeromyxobacter diazotrophicus TaxID=2590199 RepID=A0A7I9VLZ8_9BACT|nr:hemerythrin domain-containing protein [Anaeromyxobacter diazotrophicus]GEJ57007.1 hypothetical protein AMYX_17480 [Anaeromyxobacter diazotrophicus]